MAGAWKCSVVFFFLRADLFHLLFSEEVCMPEAAQKSDLSN